MYSASVIIPVYNAEKTLRKSVEALCYGEERNLEIILIDDCSRDASWELCNILANEHLNVHCYQNENNSGVSFTRNHGLEVATAPYILFVDSDDWTSCRYASSLLSSAKEHIDSLPICGYTHINRIAGSYSISVYGTEDVEIIGIADAFSLLEHVLLQQLWNKIFRRDLIEQHHIRFDESQSMGEDFQFVLDYLEAAKIKKCVVLNEPLYYYIRWNNASLMSNFGFIDNQPEFSRMEQLARIVGPEAEARKSAMIEQSKRNYIYHIVRNRTHSKQEKLEAIERIMGDGKAAPYYREQLISAAKEQLATHLSTAKQLVPRLKGRLQRSKIQNRIAEAVKGVNAEGITFIAQNCIGGVLYHDLGLQFLSPTINMFIPEPGFVKLVLNLRHYMEQELVIRWGEKYPIGMLDDVVIHFMHYETCKEAKEAWDRRKQRINWDKIIVIGTDRNGFDDTVFEEWKKISHPKILFTAQRKYASEEDSVYFPEHEGNGFVSDLIPNREFYKDDILVNKVNHVGGQL